MWEDTVSRRTGLKGLGVLTLGGVAALAGGLAPAASAAPARIEALRVGYRCSVRVNTTTSWLEPGLARRLDRPTTSNPATPQVWEQSMTDAQHEWLVGKLDTQAALNGRLILRAIDGLWSKVSFMDQPADNAYGCMTSWVPTHHLVRDLQQLDMESGAYSVARITADRTVLYRDAAMTSPLMTIPFDTRLPVYAYTTWRADVHAAGFGTAYVRRDSLRISAPGRPTAAQVVATGRRFLGRPYLWAGTTSFGFDCSGFTHGILRHHGITIPRDATPQYWSDDLPYVSRANLRAGDLVFWAVSPGSSRMRHVGMYIGGGQVLHAPDIGSAVMVSPLDSIGPSTYSGGVRPPYAV